MFPWGNAGGGIDLNDCIGNNYGYMVSRVCFTITSLNITSNLLDWCLTCGVERSSIRVVRVSSILIR